MTKRLSYVFMIGGFLLFICVLIVFVVAVTILPDENGINLLDPIPQVAALPTPTKSRFPAPIPGLTFSQLESYFGEANIICGPMRADAVSYSAACESTVVDIGAYIYIEVYSGERPDDIYLILASVTQTSAYPSDEVAGNILAYVAAVPYENAQQAAAVQWVVTHISDNDDPKTYISDVRYHIPESDPSMRILAIGQGSDE